VVAGYRTRVTGEIQVVLDQPGPKVEPPLKIKVEHGDDVQDLDQLRKELKYTLRGKLIFAPRVELVPPGTLPRFEMKAQLIYKAYEQK